MEIYDPDGRYLGVVDLPIMNRPTPAVRGNRIAGVVRDELDVEYVVVLELGSGSAR
jgi:CRISPR/Cas system CMR subunit Cmr4 (Cas7 group RAMP superfamily)